MHLTKLRKVGGSVMLAVPPALLDLVHLRPGATVGLIAEKDRLVVKPQRQPRYTLEELLAKCDPKAPGGRRERKQDREWLEASATGRELL